MRIVPGKRMKNCDSWYKSVIYHFNSKHHISVPVLIRFESPQTSFSYAISYPSYFLEVRCEIFMGQHYFHVVDELILLLLWCISSPSNDNRKTIYQVCKILTNSLWRVDDLLLYGFLLWLQLVAQRYLTCHPREKLRESVLIPGEHSTVTTALLALLPSNEDTTSAITKCKHLNPDVCLLWTSCSLVAIPPIKNTASSTLRIKVCK